MRKVLLTLFLLALAAPSLFAQDWRDRRGDRYDRHYRDNAFELTPFAGYTTGGTLNADTGLFNEDLDLESSANYGVNFSFPLGNDFKLELMADHQSTNLLGNRATLFSNGERVGDISVTYYHAGVLIPLNHGRRGGPEPFLVVSAGVANLDPSIDGASSSSANRFSASFGGGVKIPFSPTAGVRFEGRGFFTSTNRDNSCRRCSFDENNRDLYQGQANVGIYFKF